MNSDAVAEVGRDYEEVFMNVASALKEFDLSLKQGVIPQDYMSSDGNLTKRISVNLTKKYSTEKQILLVLKRVEEETELIAEYDVSEPFLHLFLPLTLTARKRMRELRMLFSDMAVSEKIVVVRENKILPLTPEQKDELYLPEGMKPIRFKKSDVERRTSQVKEVRQSQNYHSKMDLRAIPQDVLGFDFDRIALSEDELAYTLKNGKSLGDFLENECVCIAPTINLYATIDHSGFDLASDNRDVTEPHVARVCHNMLNVGNHPSIKIMDPQLKIRNGQHSTESHMRAGSFVWFMILPDRGPAGTIASNTASKQLILPDHIKILAAQGNPNYKRIQKLVKKYKGDKLNPEVALRLVFPFPVYPRTKLTLPVSQGQLVCRPQDIRRAEEILEELREVMQPITSKLWCSKHVVESWLLLRSLKGFEIETFKGKLGRLGLEDAIALTKKPTLAGETLLKCYNSKRGTNKVDFKMCKNFLQDKIAGYEDPYAVSADEELILDPRKFRAI